MPEFSKNNHRLYLDLSEVIDSNIGDFPFNSPSEKVVFFDQCLLLAASYLLKDLYDRQLIRALETSSNVETLLDVLEQHSTLLNGFKVILPSAIKAALGFHLSQRLDFFNDELELTETPDEEQNISSQLKMLIAWEKAQIAKQLASLPEN